MSRGRCRGTSREGGGVMIGRQPREKPLEAEEESDGEKRQSNLKEERRRAGEGSQEGIKQEG